MTKFQIKRCKGSTKAKIEDAFTLTDLLVALACVAILGLMTLPSLARNQQKPQAMICLNNHKQLALAAIMYAADNRDNWLPNEPSQQPTWAGGIMSWDNNNLDNTNINKLIDSKYSPIAPYIRISRIFKCPGDMSTTSRGPRVRSVSMNGAVGTLASSVGIALAGQPVVGEWLTGNLMRGLYSEWRTYGKTSSMGTPGPSMLFLFTDEHPNSIYDATFAVQCGYTNELSMIIDFPANYHDGGGTFSFCDGHAELHQWKGKFIQPSITKGASIGNGAVRNVASDSVEDVKWLQARTSARR